MSKIEWVRLENGHAATTMNLDHRQVRVVVEALAEATEVPVRFEVRVAGSGGRHERVEFVRVRPSL